MQKSGLMAALLLSTLLGACAPLQPIEDKDNKNYSGFTSKEEGDQPVGQGTYSREETVKAAQEFFGDGSEGIAKAIERAFSQYGQPVGYIAGEEGGGAIVAGLRYGTGILSYKGGGSMQVYWQAPSVGFDFGANASKVFTLVYGLRNTYELFQRYPTVDGSLYVVAGVGLNYQRVGNIVLAPIRTGVGLRAGASVGYTSYTRESTVNPF